MISLADTICSHHRLGMLAGTSYTPFSEAIHGGKSTSRVWLDRHIGEPLYQQPTQISKRSTAILETTTR